MSLGDRMRQIREDQNLSGAIFGERIKMTRSSISNMEKGQRPITDRTIKLICSEFNVNERWLRTGEGDMYNLNSAEDLELMELFGKMLHADEIDPTVRDLMLTVSKLNDEYLAKVLNIALDYAKLSKYESKKKK